MFAPRGTNEKYPEKRQYSNIDPGNTIFYLQVKYLGQQPHRHDSVGNTQQCPTAEKRDGP